jgi:hypothetical protein
MKNGYVIKKRNIFTLDLTKPFRISRSQIEAYVQCPHCFWMNHRRGIRRPSMPGHPINSLIDRLLKAEFDAHRVAGTPHPLMIKHDIDAVPLAHPQLEEWRQNFKGMQSLHEPTGLLITGALDDLWCTPANVIHMIDYKATSKQDGVCLDDEWKDGYKRQIEVYQWLARRQGLKVSDTGYFVYCNGTYRPVFNGAVMFDQTILPYVGNDAWVEPTLLELKDCLSSDIVPAPAADCEYCGYVEARRTS